MVYFIRCLGTSFVKIGYCNDGPEALSKRLHSLQTGNALALIPIGRIPGDYETEKRLHKALSSRRMVGEWFALDVVDMAELLPGCSDPPIAVEYVIQKRKSPKRPPHVQSFPSWAEKQTCPAVVAMTMAQKFDIYSLLCKYRDAETEEYEAKLKTMKKFVATPIGLIDFDALRFKDVDRMSLRKIAKRASGAVGAWS